MTLNLLWSLNSPCSWGHLPSHYYFIFSLSSKLPTPPPPSDNLAFCFTGKIEANGRELLHIPVHLFPPLFALPSISLISRDELCMPLDETILLIWALDTILSYCMPRHFFSLFFCLCCINNLSFLDYSRAYKLAVISLHLKENALDPTLHSICCPISLLSFTGKLLERVVSCCL